MLFISFTDDLMLSRYTTLIYTNKDCFLFSVYWLPCGSAGKESNCNARDLGPIPGLGRYPGEGKGYTLQYSGLENSIDCIVHGLIKSWTGLGDFDFDLAVFS